MQIDLQSISAVHEIASAIAGVPEQRSVIHIYDAPLNASATIRSGSEFTEIRLAGSGQGTATVTITRPTRHPWDEGHLTPANVNWSSSSSQGDLQDAAATARLLGVAVEVATLLNSWADRDLLPYLNGEAA